MMISYEIDVNEGLFIRISQLPNPKRWGPVVSTFLERCPSRLKYIGENRCENTVAKNNVPTGTDVLGHLRSVLEHLVTRA